MVKKKEPEPEIEVACAACQHVHGSFTSKALPKSFACSKCGLGQSLDYPNRVGYTMGRNYPDGFFE